MNMDDLPQNNYPGENPPVSREAGNTVDEVWKRISAGRYGMDVTMKLKDYFPRAGVMGQLQGAVEGGVTVVSTDYGQQLQNEEGFLGFGDGGLDGGGGIGRRFQDQPDKVAELRQRRMIKNRESAARSRQRKQEYTVELELRVERLQEQNSKLKQQQDERRRKRLKLLHGTRIPVVREKPRRCLRKTLSF